MKPAISVIFLTTLIGAGQGLFLAWYSAEFLALLNLLPVIQGDSFVIVSLSLTLLIAGLIASFFHLGHPERAWRAAAMWRTSWLSREVILLPITMGLIFLYWAVSFFGSNPVVHILANGSAIQLSHLFGLLASLVILALFVCTAMIYSCLKFLRQWHSPFTVINFFLMGSASGFTLAAAQAAILREEVFGYLVGMAIFFTFAALTSRWLSLQRNRKLRSPTTLQSAIGVHHPSIRQIAQGAMGGSFNTRAFIHSYGAGVVRLARKFFLLAGFVIPLALLWFSEINPVAMCSVAFGLQFIGLLCERWYFFIEAEHPQNVYYQMIS